MTGATVTGAAPTLASVRGSVWREFCGLHVVWYDLDHHTRRRRHSYSARGRVVGGLVRLGGGLSGSDEWTHRCHDGCKRDDRGTCGSYPGDCLAQALRLGLGSGTGSIRVVYDLFACR